MKSLALVWVAGVLVACDAAKALRRLDKHGLEPFEDDEVVDEDFAKRLDTQIAKNSKFFDYTDGNSDANPAGAEVDSNGFIVIDNFCGFTKKAAAHVKQNLFMACEFVAEAITSSLTDSGITNVRVRVVGAELFGEDEDLDVKWNELNNADLKESTKMILPMGAKHGADVMTSFLKRNASLGGGVSGRAYVPGTTSIVNIETIGTAQHEMGHNFGLRHCPSPSYPNGNTGYEVKALGYGTTLCGDVIPYWSTPKILYNGHPIGDSVTSSVKWLQKSLGPMSSEARHVYPLDDTVHQRKIIQTGTVILGKKNKMSNSFAINITSDMPTVWVTTNRGEIGQFYIGKFAPPTESNHYTRTNYPLVQITNAPPGLYYVAIKARQKGAEGTTRTVNVWVPGDLLTTTTPKPTTTTTTKPTTTTTTKPTTTTTPKPTTTTTTKPTTTTTKPTTTTTTKPTTTTKTSTARTTTTVTTTTSTTKAPTTTSDSIPAWDKNTIYSAPCTKVRHVGYVFVNGWYIINVEPNPEDTKGVWRIVGSPDEFPECKKN